MTRNTTTKEGLAFPAQTATKILGENIRIARKRRSWTIEEMASSMLVQRKTLSRLEAGDPSVGLSVFGISASCIGNDQGSTKCSRSIS